MNVSCHQLCHLQLMGSSGVLHHRRALPRIYLCCFQCPGLQGTLVSKQKINLLVSSTCDLRSKCFSSNQDRMCSAAVQILIDSSLRAPLLASLGWSAWRDRLCFQVRCCNVNYRQEFIFTALSKILIIFLLIYPKCHSMQLFVIQSEKMQLIYVGCGSYRLLPAYW